MNIQPVDCRYELFVDGSPGPKSGPGWAGWGIVMMAGQTPIYEACGTAARRLTVNGIELEAMIQGLSYLLRMGMPTVTPVWTDSQYVMNSMMALPRLKKEQFLQKDGHPIVNSGRLRLLFDLYYTMEAVNLCVLRKVRGHEGVAGNERADELSKLAAYKGESWYQDVRFNNESTTENEQD